MSGFANHEKDLFNIIQDNYGTKNVRRLKNKQIVVDKDEHKLSLVVDGKVLKEYKIGLSGENVGDKYFQGDGRTPEGEFYFAYTGRGNYGLSFKFSYPSIKHAKRGLKYGIITEGEYKRIIRANKSCKMPPQNTNLGSWVVIHGGGNEDDWTAGCVALDDGESHEIKKFIVTGCSERATRLVIKDTVEKPPDFERSKFKDKDKMKAYFDRIDDI